MSARKTFGGFQDCSPGWTNANKPKDNSEQGLLRTILNGTFFTSDHQGYRAPGDTEACPFCGLQDNQLHRHCPKNIKNNATINIQPWVDSKTCSLRSI